MINIAFLLTLRNSSHARTSSFDCRDRSVSDPVVVDNCSGISRAVLEGHSGGQDIPPGWAHSLWEIEKHYLKKSLKAQEEHIADVNLHGCDTNKQRPGKIGHLIRDDFHAPSPAQKYSLLKSPSKAFGCATLSAHIPLPPRLGICNVF